MNSNKHFITQTITALFLIALGAGLGYTIAINNHPVIKVAQPATNETILYWYDPMKPDQHFDRSGKSPYMDMELIPKYADAKTPANDIRIDSRVTQNIGVKLGSVGKFSPTELLEDKNQITQEQDDLDLPDAISNASKKTPSTMPPALLWVPSEAIIATGRHTFVILSEESGHFKPAEVVIGKERHGKTEIISGLHEGEKIVISGQFLIDSEANFSSSLNRMSGAGETP